MSDPKSVEDKLSLLQDKYINSLPAKITDIKQEWNNCKSSKTITEKNLESMLHKLAGSAGMYDLYELGEQARALELSIISPESALTNETIQTFDDGLDVLKGMVAELSE